MTTGSAGGSELAPHYDVVVVGASIAGAALALALRDRELSFLIVDPQTSFDERKMTWGHDLEPNALAALDRIGMLDVISDAGARHDHWYAYRAGGGKLSEWSYTDLPHPYPYAVCIRAHVLRELLRAHVGALPGVDLRIPATFSSLRHTADSLEVTIEVGGESRTVTTQLLVGADGPRSSVRTQSGIGADVSRYSHSWSDAIMSTTDQEVTEGHIYFGRGSYLGIVPTRARELVAFELTRAKSTEEYRAQFADLDAFREHYARVAPILAGPVHTIEGWDAVTVAPSFRMRTHSWVADRVALAGDAALTVNPITSQGVCLALEEAVSLATVVAQCFRNKDFSRDALLPYELWRRPQAETVQELGDVSLFAFGSRNPVVSAVKDRMLARMEQDPEFRTYVMAAYCGLHWLTPRRLSRLDGVRAVGMLPRGRMFAPVRRARAAGPAGRGEAAAQPA